MAHEVGLDATFEELLKFATNILEQANTGSQFKDIDVRNSYWSAAMQVLLTRKIDGALNRLAASVDAASKTSTADSHAATFQARRMVTATWALVVVTTVLSIATGSLVWYTRQLAYTLPPMVVVAPNTSKGGN